MNTRTFRIKRLTRVTLLGSALVTPAVLMGVNPAITSVMAAENGDQTDHDGHDHAQSASDGGDSVTRWTCPMHPQIVEEEPGSCPICGMDLVEKEFPAEQTSQAASESQDRAAPDEGHEGQTLVESSDETGETVTRYTCPMHPQIVEEEPGSCPICGMDLVEKEYPAQEAAAETSDSASGGASAQGGNSASSAASGGETVTRWTCPMHPQIIEEEPGSCPICGMDLVEKEYPASEVGAASAESSGGNASRPKAPSFPAVSVSPITVQHMNVVIEEAKKRPLVETIRTVGTVGYDEDLLAHVHPRAKGWVEQLKVASVGTTVKKGDVLFEYYSPDIVAAQQDYLVALRRGMSDLIESSRARLELLDVPESVIDTVRQKGKVQRTIPLLAPQDGYVAEINLREGMYIQPGLDLYTIARRDRVWVNVDVLERRMQSVSEGQEATMRVDGIPGRTFEGTVDFVYPELDPQSRTLRVRLAFDNEDGQLRPNQFAEVTLTPEKTPPVLAVPATAIIPSPGGARVVVRTGEGRFRPVAVETGAEAGGYTEIVSGLEPGEQVVASGQFLIDSESNVQAAFSRLSGNEQ
ncbi:efflux RND transporter periplasmic adaptor subunit [Guyparkeria hydrothermalis]|uniref:efflux RND transporter periplasmic adaptor subunit n=1 Tax=Guyparkeria hydrothermalis TaxID=923 RepID=UPI00202262A2|nr:efflux RND transporter periplasmic adaptor subunit [Guyparkeria hydrothermalis]MCL7750632.1 efflux RND transporter periplasmic adaptor subunit [Guyparkeria hydrothermalis]